MNPLRWLLAALTPEAESQAARTRAVAASLKELRSDVQSLRREVATVVHGAETLAREVAQARRLEADDRNPATLDALAAVLGEDRLAVHVRSAIARAALLDDARARLVVEQCWPDGVHEALVHAVPDAVFFDGPESGAQTVRVPPRLAPVTSIAVWTFVARIVRDVVVPAVAARLGVSGALDVAPGRLVRRPAGSAPVPATLKPWHAVLIEIDLSAPRIIVGSAEVYDPPAPETGVTHTYEVWFGPRPT